MSSRGTALSKAWTLALWNEDALVPYGRKSEGFPQGCSSGARIITATV